MNKAYKYTLTAHEKKEISFDTGVARLAIANGDGVDGSTTVVMSEITKQHSGDIVSFIDGADAPFADFIVNIVATQSGTGDPSPTNIRPITGWTGATINVSGEDTSDPTTYPISWQSTAGTVYGGTLDVTTGVLTVNRAMMTFKDASVWSVNVSSGHYRAYTYALADILPWNDNDHATTVMICDRLSTGPWADVFVGTTVLGQSNKAIGFGTDSLGITDTTSLGAWLANNPLTVCYDLATPITYQLTPTEIRSLLGVNNVWADCGSIDLKYFVQSTQPMIDYIDDKTENVTRIFKATDNGGGVFTLDDITCGELCLYARDHSNIALKVTRYSSAIAYDIFILSDYIGTSAVFRNTMITSAIGGGSVLYVRELQADNGSTSNVLTTRNVNITADT